MEDGHLTPGTVTRQWRPSKLHGLGQKGEGPSTHASRESPRNRRVNGKLGFARDRRRGRGERLSCQQTLLEKSVCRGEKAPNLTPCTTIDSRWLADSVKLKTRKLPHRRTAVRVSKGGGVGHGGLAWPWSREARPFLVRSTESFMFHVWHLGWL